MSSTEVNTTNKHNAYNGTSNEKLDPVSTTTLSYLDRCSTGKTQNYLYITANSMTKVSGKKSIEKLLLTPLYTTVDQG